MLMGLRVHYQNAHWTASGPNYYGDHLLYGRLYEEIEDEIDAMAEKIIGLDGASQVIALEQAKGVLKFFESLKSTHGLVNQSLVAERALLVALERAYDAIDLSGQMTLGLDDFIMALANSHEHNVYLLRQRKEV